MKPENEQLLLKYSSTPEFIVSAEIESLLIVLRNLPINYTRKIKKTEFIKSMNDSLSEKILGLSFCEQLDFLGQFTKFELDSTDFLTLKGIFKLSLSEITSFDFLGWNLMTAILSTEIKLQTAVNESRFQDFEFFYHFKQFVSNTLSRFSSQNAPNFGFKDLTRVYLFIEQLINWSRNNRDGNNEAIILSLKSIINTKIFGNDETEIIKTFENANSFSDQNLKEKIEIWQSCLKKSQEQIGDQVLVFSKPL